MLASLRAAFLAGLVLLAPLTVTLYVFKTLVTAIGGGFRRQFFFFVPDQFLPEIVWDFLATLLILAAITLLGYLSRWFLGRLMVNTTERVIERLPFINTIYRSVKQIVQTFSTQQKAIFQEVVLLEYPRKGIYAIGFRTSTSGGEVQARTSRTLDNVFVPTTPNPTSGFLLMLPKEEITTLDMSVGDGMKLIISGGAVVPEFSPDGQKVLNLQTPSGKVIATRD